MSDMAKMDKYFKNLKIPDHLSKEEMKTLKEWLSKQLHLPQISDRQIAIFLHSCFGALELTKNTIDIYYTIRTHATELFQNRKPEELSETLKVVWCSILEKKSPDGCRIVMLGLKDPNSDKFNLLGFVRELIAFLDILAVENSFDEGLRLVYNMTGATFGHFTKFSMAISVLMKLFVYLQGVGSIDRTSEYVSGLPGLSLDKHHLIIAGLNDLDSEKFFVPAACKLFFSLLDIEGNLAPHASGWRVIISAKGLSFGHFTKLTTSMGTIKKVIYYLQDGLPLRLKGIHVFNAIPLVNKFLALIRPIMKKELYDLIKIHPTDDSKSLYKFIPQENLPSDFGGQAPSIDQLIEKSTTMLEEYKNWFIDDETYGRVDESKRAGKDKNACDIFGIEGSFKKLDFD